MFTCNVCDRTYRTARNLAKHQVYKQHFGCSICDTVFSSLYSLEQHKHTLEHWSDDETNLYNVLNRQHFDEHDIHHSHQCNNRKKRTKIPEHNHPMVMTNSLSNHGYPSDSIHSFATGEDQHHHNHLCSDNHNQQTILCLNNTTITGLLDSKLTSIRSHNNKSNSNNSFGNFMNNINNFINNHSTTIEKLDTLRVNKNNINYRKVDQTKPKPILASSLSSKLMASVFNFSSSTSSSSTSKNIPNENNNIQSNMPNQTSQQQQTLNSNKQLSKSAEEMESLL